MNKKSKISKWKKAKRSFLFYVYNLFAFPLLYLMLHLYYFLLKWKSQGMEQVETAVRSGKPLIFAFFHGDLLGILWQGRLTINPRKIHIMTSPSRDGQFLGRILRSFGYQTVIGSSASKSLAGFRGLVSKLKDGNYAAVAVDGPRGPRLQVKSGVLLLAKMTDGIVIPVIYHFNKSWTMRSWDKMEIPKPFSTITVKILNPLTIPDNTDNDMLVYDLRLKLEEVMMKEKQSNVG